MMLDLHPEDGGSMTSETLVLTTSLQLS